MLAYEEFSATFTKLGVFVPWSKGKQPLLKAAKAEMFGALREEYKRFLESLDVLGWTIRQFVGGHGALQPSYT